MPTPEPAALKKVQSAIIESLDAMVPKVLSTNDLMSVYADVFKARQRKLATAEMLRIQTERGWQDPDLEGLADVAETTYVACHRGLSDGAQKAFEDEMARLRVDFAIPALVARTYDQVLKGKAFGLWLAGGKEEGGDGAPAAASGGPVAAPAKKGCLVIVALFTLAGAALAAAL